MKLYQQSSDVNQRPAVAEAGGRLPAVLAPRQDLSRPMTVHAAAANREKQEDVFCFNFVSSCGKPHPRGEERFITRPLKAALERLQSILDRPLPDVDLVVTNDPARLGRDPLSGLPWSVKADFEKHRVFIHSSLIGKDAYELCRGLCCGLISQLEIGISDPSLAISHTAQVLLDKPFFDCAEILCSLPPEKAERAAAVGRKAAEYLLTDQGVREYSYAEAISAWRCCIKEACALPNNADPIPCRPYQLGGFYEAEFYGLYALLADKIERVKYEEDPEPARRQSRGAFQSLREACRSEGADFKIATRFCAELAESGVDFRPVLASGLPALVRAGLADQMADILQLFLDRSFINHARTPIPLVSRSRPEYDNDNVGLDWMDSNPEPGCLIASLMEALSHFPRSLGRAPQVLKEVGEMVAGLRSADISDRRLIYSLPAIAAGVSDVDAFLATLQVEQKMAPILVTARDSYEWQEHCRDYGTIFPGSAMIPAFATTAFEAYSGLFADSATRSRWVSSLLEELSTRTVLPWTSLPEFLEEIALRNGIRPPGLLKCLVLDADGVLWPGLAGEEQLAAISDEYRRFQERILRFKRSGGLLAICSKNEPGVVEAALAGDKGMVLRPDDFVCIAGNWNDKASNLRRIAGELGIGLENMAFIDDSSHERELVRQLLPEVAVPDLPEQPSACLALLDAMLDHPESAATAESLKRTELYEQRRKRVAERAAAASLDDFRRSLSMRLLIRSGRSNLDCLSRLAELTQRTNQANLNLMRCDADYFSKAIADPNRQVFSAEVSDRIGESGIIAVAVLRNNPEYRDFEVLCVSCRAFGMQVEESLIAHIAQKSVRPLRASYVPGPRNAYMARVLAGLGFVEKAENVWICRGGDAISSPDCVQVMVV